VRTGVYPQRGASLLRGLRRGCGAHRRRRRPHRADEGAGRVQPEQRGGGRRRAGGDALTPTLTLTLALTLTQAVTLTLTLTLALAKALALAPTLILPNPSLNLSPNPNPGDTRRIRRPRAQGATHVHQRQAGNCQVRERAWSCSADSPRSREISTKVGVDSALRIMVYRGVHNAKTHSWGFDHAVVCLSVVLSTHMRVIWRCEPPFTTMSRVQR